MAKKQQLIEVEGRELTISNVEKVFFPQSGFTKGEVIASYSEIADTILPHLRDRPLTLKRYPEGLLENISTRRTLRDISLRG